MKEFNYTGDSSKLQTIADLLNEKVPLPQDPQGNVDWGTAGQVLGTDGDGNTEWVTGGSGGGNVDDVMVNGTSVVDANKVAQIKSYKEVSAAAYEALPDTKLTDDILYCIKDASGDAYSYPPLIFSLQEREIGVWLDGKPLYQRSYPVTFARTNYELQLDISVDTIMFVPEGTFNKQTSSDNVVNYGFYGTNTDRCQMYYRASENKVVILSVDNADNVGEGYVTLRYTKTTDVAGAGTWTSQGALACHYSTEEHVCGTWIDGSTIYERTFSGLSLAISNTDWMHTNITVADLGTITGIEIVDSYGQALLGEAGYFQNNEVAVRCPFGGNTIAVITLRYTKTV